MPEPAIEWVSPQQYLAAERLATEKHEYWNGQIYAMAGGKPSHSRVSSNLIIEAGGHLKSTACQTFNSDQRVYIPDAGLYTYPDISITCDPPDFHDGDCLTNPIVVIEVLSQSTEACDRGAKFAHYRRIPSLQEILFISSRIPFVEVFRRSGEGRWILEEVADINGTVNLQSVNVSIAMRDIYLKVELEDPPVLR